MIGVVTDESGSNFTWTWGKACWRCRRDSITAQRDVPVCSLCIGTGVCGRPREQNDMHTYFEDS